MKVDPKPFYFTGIRPTGEMHLGNILGMMQMLQEGDYNRLFMIADLHGISSGKKVPKDQVFNKVAELATLSKIFRKDIKIFLQSDNHDHLMAMWMISTISPIGMLKTMIQYKSAQSPTLAIMSYPSLMAADILIYNPDIVPVGDDQKQHIEYASKMAKKLNLLRGNKIFKTTWTNQKRGVRIMDLRNPEIKMSKSNEVKSGIILCRDNAEEISNKISKAVTSSLSLEDDDSSGTCNLICLYSLLTGKDIIDIRRDCNNHSELKSMLTQEIVKLLEKFNFEYNSIRQDEEGLLSILREGALYARSRSQQYTSLLNDIFFK